MSAKTLILLSLLAALRPSSCQTVRSIRPEIPVRVLPGDAGLDRLTILTCFLEPSSLANLDYVSRWIIPGGQIYTFMGDFDRFGVSQGQVQTSQGAGPATRLRVNNQSYRDAGNYTCEVRSSSASARSPWLSASVELQFEVNLQATESVMTAHSNDSQVELECEMTLFIRADQDLQWFRGSEMIASGTNRYTISYRNGSVRAAQNGGDTLIPGRVSVLTISNPQLSDSGTYSCRILGTEQSVDVQLNVEGAFPATPTPSVTATAILAQETFPAMPIPSVVATTTPTQGATPGDALSTNEIVAIVVVIGIAIFTVITITVIIIIVVVKRKKGLKPTANEAYGVNLHHLKATAPSNAQTTLTDYYVNDGLGPKQPTYEEEYSYAFPGPHIQQKSA